MLHLRSDLEHCIFVSDFQWSSFHLGRELQFGLVSSHPLCFLQDFYTFRLIFNKLATISYGSHNNFVAFCDGLRVSICLSRLLPILSSHTNSYRFPFPFISLGLPQDFYGDWRPNGLRESFTNALLQAAGLIYRLHLEWSIMISVNQHRFNRLQSMSNKTMWYLTETCGPQYSVVSS